VAACVAERQIAPGTHRSSVCSAAGSVTVVLALHQQSGHARQVGAAGHVATVGGTADEPSGAPQACTGLDAARSAAASSNGGNERTTLSATWPCRPGWARQGPASDATSAIQPRLVATISGALLRPKCS
jgi:hypothetical protein